MSEPKKSKYPNLYRRSKQKWWTYRKLTAAKGKEFVITLTGITSEAKAYAAGVAAFNAWLEGKSDLSRGGAVTIADLAAEVLSSKSGKRASTQKRARSAMNNNVLPPFGHLTPVEVTASKWSEHVASVHSRNPDFRFFNPRKYLVECLELAKTKGMIKEVPEFHLPDPDPAPPKYLTREEARAILKETVPDIKLMLYIAWRLGARPGEILQYKWSMIKWNEGESGTIYIPGSITKTKRGRAIPLNSRVSRVLKWVRKNIDNGSLLSHQNGNIRFSAARRLESDFIFPARHDPKKSRTMLRNGWAKTLKKASCRMNRCDGNCRHPELEAVIYNFRDTFITDKLIQGMSSTFVAKYVDSSTGEIEKRYAVQVRSAMERIAG